MSTNPYINALTSGINWLSIGADNTITYTFANDYGRAWTAAEKASFQAAAASYAAVCNLNFVEVATAAEADMVENLISGAQRSEIETWMDLTGVNWGGWHDEPVAGSRGFYVHDADYWASGLGVGGKAHWLITHELGHGLGLEHPHSTSHGSGLFPGVTLEHSSDPGDNGLNHVGHTVMSYRLTTSPSFDYGQIGGPMAFDIAALQEMYGARENATGADTYRLPTANAAGTFWTCIWDTGGTDTILQGGSTSATIDLRPATLQNEVGGGGFFSQSYGIHGGFSIANGVTIENAIGGYGKDTIIGNGADNFIWGRKGQDIMTGGGGADRFEFRASDETGTTATTWDLIMDFAHAQGDTINLALMDASTVTAGDDSFTWKGTGSFGTSAAGELRYELTTNGYTKIYGDTDSDTAAEFVISLMGHHSLMVNDFIL